jgi:hypothetical protein
MGAKPRAAGDLRTQFREARFEVVERGSSPESIAVKKNNCTYYLERRADGAWIRSGPPYFTVRGLECKLEDRGYQKFWYHRGQRFPVRATDLSTLHRFDEEARALLGLKSLYNESLGTTSARSVYDRLRGRPDR